MADTPLALDPATVNFVGQAVAASVGARLEVGAASFAGQSVAFPLTVAMSNASISFSGQAVPLDRPLPLSNAQVSFAGQFISLPLVVTEAILRFAGSVVPLLSLAPTTVRGSLQLPRQGETSNRMRTIWKGRRT